MLPLSTCLVRVPHPQHVCLGERGADMMVFRPGPLTAPRRGFAQSIFSDSTYSKPFFVVYINSSMFAISLIPIAIRYILRNGGFGQVRSLALQAWKERHHSSSAGTKTFNEEEAAFMADDQLTIDDEASLEGFETQGPRNSSSSHTRSKSIASDAKLTLWETAGLSLEFSILWVLANYFASACLEYTSVASSTILTSTSSIWTLIFCAVLKIESFSIRKLLAVLGSLVGVILISSIDLSGKDNDDGRGDFPHKSQREIAIGDTMAFISALVYGVYVVVMKVRIGNESRVNMPVFFGLVGTFNICLLWPVFFILHMTGIEPFELPPAAHIWGIILFNSVASFVADMSWAYAMLLTTPLVVTVGLSLTIPLSLVGEMIQYGQYSSFLYWVGAVIVVLSFIFVNHESHDDEAESHATKDVADTGVDGLRMEDAAATPRAT
ncbi:uncharacterized protein B0I36DRAFT_321059 [Microdochium trichocladiopsis]|uniref:DUF3955 domain-containing protein n=1 Tax=Microdochium trichocladiopsis TaxID=1682393 RepID=A0A9P9BS02_9PEZI|nr:uncharacterized protein B0I36DRAFT_321059 [Microdochium trichocladiopsis]KAH7033253.1 hypothetical protein B0I36DRAFT_321059 [Microdochium trichocladiopsis]